MKLSYLKEIDVKFLLQNLIVNFSEMMQYHMMALSDITKYYPRSKIQISYFSNIPFLPLVVQWKQCKKHE